MKNLVTVGLVLGGLVWAAPIARARDEGAPRQDDGKKGPDAPPARPPGPDDAKVKEFREKWLAKVPDLVKAADADADGKLSQDEFKNLVRSAMKARFELFRAMRGDKAPPDGGHRERGPRPDGDKDGAAAPPGGDGKPEAKAGDKPDGDLPKHRPDGPPGEDERAARQAEAYKKADADGDGSVSTEEATKFMENFEGPKMGRPREKKPL